MALSITVASGWVVHGNSSGLTSVTSGSFSGVAGDMFVATSYSNGNFSSFSASNGNTWTQAVSDTFGGRVFYRVLTGSETTTVTMTSVAAIGVAIKVYKVTGQDPMSPTGATGFTRLDSTA